MTVQYTTDRIAPIPDIHRIVRILVERGVSIEVHGGLDDGFGPVADAFAENFTAGGEVGARRVSRTVASAGSSTCGRARRAR